MNENEQLRIACVIMQKYSHCQAAQAENHAENTGTDEFLVDFCVVA